VPRPASSLPPAVLKHEALRALAGFAIYLLLYPLWSWVGAGRAYDALIRAIAARVDEATRHFPHVTGIQQGPLGFYDVLILLVLACAAVSRGMPLASRARRSLALILVIVVSHVSALILQARVAMSREVWASERIMLLLPRERQIALWLKHAVYEFGLQLAPFVIVGLWVYWNLRSRNAWPASSPPAGFDERGRSWSRVLGLTRPAARLLATSSAVILSISIFLLWSAWRERLPEHVRAHLWLTERFLRDRNWALAETQLQAAIDGGCRDDRVFLKLAAIAKGQGDFSGAVAVLERGLLVVSDSEGKTRLRRALDDSMRDASWSAAQDL